MVRLTDRPDMTLDVYHGRKTITQQQQCSAQPGKQVKGQSRSCFEDNFMTLYNSIIILLCFISVEEMAHKPVGKCKCCMVVYSTKKVKVSKLQVLWKTPLKCHVMKC